MCKKSQADAETLELIHAYFKQLEYSRQRQLQLVDQIIGGESALEMNLSSEFLLEEFLKTRLMRMLGSVLPNSPRLVDPYTLPDELLVSKLVEVG
jgi:hypothetical protein